MLNRRLSEYLFYGSLALITIVVLLINMIVMGNINDKIDSTTSENIILTNQITELEEIVQDNLTVQTSHIYELYSKVPGVYSGTELELQTYAMLEGLYITDEFNRFVTIDDNPSFASDTAFYELAQKYKFVEVEVKFSAQNTELVSDLIDEIYNHPQIFIVRTVSYKIPEGAEYPSMTVKFLAMYAVEETEEES